MTEHWSLPVKHDPWQTRRYVDTLLFDGITFFHWLCLCTSKNLRWPERGRATTIYHEISVEHWHWQCFWVPDITIEDLEKCDQDLWNWGWLQRIDESIADAMIAERLQCCPTSLNKDKLIGRRIYSEEGWRIWSMIEVHLRAPKGPRLSGEKFEGFEVFHQGVPFFVSQCCDDCVRKLDEKRSISRAVEIGPWCSQGVVMPRGWRHICEHPVLLVDWTKTHPAVPDGTST